MPNSTERLQSLRAERLRRREAGPFLSRLRAERERRTAEKAKARLTDFLRAAWPVVEPAAPLVWGWHLDAIAEHLEAVTRGQIKNLLITLPPGCTKSILVGVMWPAWVWASNPSVRWLCAANEGDLATRDSLACRNVIQSDWYRTHYPDVVLTSDQNVKTWYQTSARGHRQALTVAGSVTGKKGDILLVDDANDANTVESEAERQAVCRWWKSFYNRVNDYKTARRVVIGQRTHVGDLQGHLLASGFGFEELSILEEFEPTRRTFTLIGWTDPRTAEGEWLRPERFGPEQKREAVGTLGTQGYRAQHQQNPQNAEGTRFKRAWFDRRRWRFDGDFVILNDGQTPPQRFNWRTASRWGTADGAASAKTSADFTCVCGWMPTPRNDLVWWSCRRERLEIPDQPGMLQAEYTEHQFQWVGVEAVLSNVALYQHAMRTTMAVRKLDPEGKDKLARATPAIVFAEAGRLWLPDEETARKIGFPLDAVLAELTAFTGDDGQDEHDDIVDTLAYAIKCHGPGGTTGGSSGPSAVKPSGPAASAPLPGIRGGGPGGGLRGFAR